MAEELKLVRYHDDAPVDYMCIDENGEWLMWEAHVEAVAELTRERDEARAELRIAWEDDPLVPELRAEVSRLQSALAAAERDKLSAEAQASDWRRSLGVAEARVRELEEMLRVERIGREESVRERNDAESDVSDLRTRIAELEAVLDQETKSRLEAEAELSSMARLRDIAEQRLPAILRFRERVDADQS